MTEDALVSAGAGLVGALIGALAALIASWIQNRHDAEQRERERTMSLRRDVYLEAAEAIAGAPQYLAGIADADMPGKDLAPLLNTKLGWQNKLHVIASLEVISAFSEADALFIATVFELFPKRHRLDGLARLAAEEQEKRAQLTQYQGFLHTALKSQVPQMPQEQRAAAAEAIRFDIERTQAEIVASYQRESELHDERAAGIAELLDLSVSSVAKHRLLVGKAIAAVRRELDAPIDQKAYEALVEKMNQQFFSAYRPFSERLKQEQ